MLKPISGERTISTEETTYSRKKGNMYEENDGDTDFSAIIKKKDQQWWFKT